VSAVRVRRDGRDARVATATSVRVGRGRGAAAAAVSSAGVTALRAATPLRQWVNTPDHANMALKAMTSNRARL